MASRTDARLACLLMLAAAAFCGCGERSDLPVRVPEARPAPHRDRPADEFLNSVFTRYRNSASYHDEGVVRISYDEGRWETKTAPLRVWFSHDQLYVEAYKLNLWSSRRSVNAWVIDPATADFDSQVLYGQPIAGRPNLESLLSDDIMIEQLNAGMVGPPPQLEWLFAAEPMQHLFDNDHHFSYGQDREIEGFRCLSVQVDAAGEPFRFWVDRNSGLIRRVDLPPIVQGTKDGFSARIKLSLDLRGASFDTPPTGPSFAPLPARPKYVRSFVPLPPIQPAAILGTRAAPFRLPSSDASFTLTERGSDRPVTVVLLDSADARSNAAARLLRQWVGMMAPALRSRVRVLVVLDESREIAQSKHPAVATVIDGAGTVAAAYRMQPGSLFVLRPGGEVGWVQPDLDPQSLVNLGAIMGDILDGIDVPARIRDQWNAAVADYQARLQQSRISAN